jgi:hypothetical protein
VDTNAEQDKLQRADHDTLVRVESKLDSLSASVSTIQTDHETRLRLIEKDERVRMIEQRLDSTEGIVKGFRWALAVVTAVVGIVEPFILFYLAKG